MVPVGISANPLVVANENLQGLAYRIKFVFQPSISNDLSMSK
jgi:hypothetical protein